MTPNGGYPEKGPDRNRWITSRRGARQQVDPSKPLGFMVEEERSASGEIVPVATILLASRECPWKCLMCDLWKRTLVESPAPGVIPAQIALALAQLPPARQIKLYNNGNFFDPMAVPIEDYSAIAGCLHSFERVIVECHPSLLGETAVRFRDLLSGTLEVAVGLETSHPQVLERLNKHMTAELFSRAALYLHEHRISLRTLVLVKPPFLDEREALLWARRSVEFAFDCGSEVVCLIPTRAGNGALEELARDHLYEPPRLATLEAALDDAIRRGQGRVLADLHDLEQFCHCDACFDARKERLEQMNLQQTNLPPVACAICAGHG